MRSYIAFKDIIFLKTAEFNPIITLLIGREPIFNEKVASADAETPLQYPEDKPRLTNEFMVQIAKEYMEKMGIKDTQYVIVRHYNTPNPIAISSSTVWTTTANASPTATG